MPLLFNDMVFEHMGLLATAYESAVFIIMGPQVTSPTDEAMVLSQFPHAASEYEVDEEGYPNR